jgi:23S rRNA (adenine2503-C2)-methyltransferase
VEKKIDIRQLSLEELTEYFTEIGEKAFRAKQVYEWLWRKGATSFDDMTNLSLLTRDRLSEKFEIRFLQIAEAQKKRR